MISSLVAFKLKSFHESCCSGLMSTVAAVVKALNAAIWRSEPRSSSSMQ
jgi:hypothetical protein